MKKFLNDPVNFVDEMLEGIYRAHPELTFVNDDKRCMVTAKPKAGKVGIATGGGSGHLPTFLGYIGENMIDGAAVGGVVQSPIAEQMYQSGRRRALHLWQLHGGHHQFRHGCRTGRSRRHHRQAGCRQ